MNLMFADELAAFRVHRAAALRRRRDPSSATSWWSTRTVRVAAPGFDAAVALGVITAAALGGKQVSAGTMARVAVIGGRALTRGRVLVALLRR